MASTWSDLSPLHVLYRNIWTRSFPLELERVRVGVSLLSSTWQQNTIMGSIMAKYGYFSILVTSGFLLDGGLFEAGVFVAFEQQIMLAFVSRGFNRRRTRSSPFLLPPRHGCYSQNWTYTTFRGRLRRHIPNTVAGLWFDTTLVNRLSLAKGRSWLQHCTFNKDTQ